jgi:heterodisulfide reductase subunit A-like polyferredoxin
MPAYLADVERAEEEGIKISFLVTPLRFIEEKGKINAVECIEMEIGEPDESGRRRPFPIEGSEFIIEIDTAILAIGQTVDNSSIPKNIEVTKSGTVIVDEITKQTNIKNVFSCGDVVLGPASVIEAISEGKEAAESIHRYLRGENLRKGRDKPKKEIKEIPIAGFDIQKRQIMPELELDNIRDNFDETELGFSEKMAIKEAERCLSCGGCSECYECEKVCDPGAIDHNLTKKEVVVNVESIIIATGLDIFDPSELKEYGYGRFKNVITALEFERMITATGPTSGELIRPSDLKHPHDVTFIQCVGSRSFTKGYPYCSTVCCMHATKEGILVKEHVPDSEVYIFYTDIRAFGKQFREFINRAKTEYGIKFIRAKPGEIREDPDTKNLSFWYENTLTGEVTEKVTNLLVLCTALTPNKENIKLAKILGVDVDDYGFFVQTDPIIAPLSTSCDGIFVCGYSQGPKDIPDSICEASGIATMVSLKNNVKTMDGDE